MFTGIPDSDMPGTLVTMIPDAPDKVSVHELDMPVAFIAVRVGAGDRVVMEKSGTVIVLKLANSMDDR
jgi:regulator of RNase E activity RraA